MDIDGAWVFRPFGLTGYSAMNSAQENSDGCGSCYSSSPMSVRMVRVCLPGDLQITWEGFGMDRSVYPSQYFGDIVGGGVH